MEALAEIVSAVDRLQDEIPSLLGMLVQYGFMSEGRSVQKTFAQLLSIVKSKMEEIWPSQKPEQSSYDLSTIAVSVYLL